MHTAIRKTRYKKSTAKQTYNRLKNKSIVLQERRDFLLDI